MVKKQFRLPYKLNDISAHILEALYSAPPAGWTAEQIREAKPDVDPIEIGRTMHNLCNAGSVVKGRKTKAGHVVWHISERGAFIHENIRDVNVYRRDDALKTLPKKPRKKPEKPALKPAVGVIEPIEHNTSATAERVADSISELISENAGYRELLLKLHDTIERAMGLGKFAPATTDEQ